MSDTIRADVQKALEGVDPFAIVREYSASDEWRDYIERNRQRRMRIASETGLPFNEIG